ncbi:MAG: AbrB/MazE/SpoVT family DNA-binding domain-containing protein [Halobacteriota archaeon]
MTADDTDPASIAGLFAEAMESAGTNAASTSKELTEAMAGVATGRDEFPLDAIQETATFKTRVQSSGRISIPDAEREILGIEEGDIVQAVIVPLHRGGDDD